MHHLRMRFIVPAGRDVETSDPGSEWRKRSEQAGSRSVSPTWSPVLPRGFRRLPAPGRQRSSAGARIRTWELLREQILSLPPLAARPPRRSCRQGGDLNCLPAGLFPPRRGRHRLLRKRASLALARRGVVRSRATPSPAPVRTPSAPFVPGHNEGRRARDARPECGCGRCAPLPSRRSIPGSTVHGTPGGNARCSGIRSPGRARRSGPRASDPPGSPPAARARKGRGSSLGRCVPWWPCADRAGPGSRDLGTLAYGAVHGSWGDRGMTANAPLDGQTGGDGHRSRWRGNRRGWRTGHRNRSFQGRGGSTPFGLGQRPSTVRAEERSRLGERATMETDTHALGKLYPLISRYRRC